MYANAFEILPRCTHCYGDTPKANKREQRQPMSVIKSEYQAAFKDWPWQPRPKCMKPEQRKISVERTKSHMEPKSTYGIDFGDKLYTQMIKMAPRKQKSTKRGLPAVIEDATQFKKYFPKKALVSKLMSPDVENAKVIHPSNSQPFQGDTIYNAAYTLYDPATMAASHQPVVKGKENLELPAIETKEAIKSTAQDDFIHHENVDRPATIQPDEKAELPMEPSDQNTENDDLYTTRHRDAHLCRTKPSYEFEAISVAMSDFKKPEGFERSVPCAPPPVSNHFATGEFDGTTTSSSAYKPFPVKPYELPVWAKKQAYIRPKGGMILNSLYKHDFVDPKGVHRCIRINPHLKNKNIVIMNDKGDCRFTDESTYKKDFPLWENVHPREMYKIIEVYQPPKEKMMCETNHRSAFTGVKADRMKPCRHSSQYKLLNIDTSGMAFVTTYIRDFTIPRPKTSPSTGPEAHRSGQQRASSAKQVTADSVNTSRKTTANKIPTPFQDQVDFPKIDNTCQSCKKDAEGFKCEE